MGTHILQAVVNGRSNVQSVAPRVLGGDEHVFPRKPALPHGPSGLLLIAVHLRSICRLQDVALGQLTSRVAVARLRMNECKGGNLTCRYG